MVKEISKPESTAPTIEQYFMAAAKPPKIVFEQLILQHRVRNKYDGCYYQPDYGTPEYKAMVTALIKAEVDYRTEFAKTMIESLIEGKE